MRCIAARLSKGTWALAEDKSISRLHSSTQLEKVAADGCYVQRLQVLFSDPYSMLFE
jgi:hypothetical protein